MDHDGNPYALRLHLLRQRITVLLPSLPLKDLVVLGISKALDG
jgi:hypothetical protein